MDYDYWIRIAKHYGTLGYISDYLANSRLYQETKTMSKRLEAHEEILNVIRKHYGTGKHSFDMDLCICAYVYGSSDFPEYQAEERSLYSGTDTDDRIEIFRV